MSRRRRLVYFVCSSGLHVRLFAATIRKLYLRDYLQPVILSLDSFYAGVHGDVRTTATDLQLPSSIVETDFLQGDRLGLIRRAYMSQTAGLRGVAAILSRNETGLVVLGNDTGHAERAVIAAAASKNIPTLLVQDGFLFDQFSNDFFGRSQLALRKLWLALWGERLGGVPYGMGGCNVIALQGERWMETILRGKRRATKRIEVIGHPALDCLDRFTPPSSLGHTVIYFCSNFLSAFNDASLHDNQIREIINLRDLLTLRYGETTVLHVKLHPADGLEDYASLSGLSGVVLHKEAVLTDLIRKSWVCVTNISSVSLECLAVGRICLMSGISLQSSRYRRLFAKLPGTKFFTWESFLNSLEELESPNGYAQALYRQREGQENWTGLSANGSERLLELIDELSDARTD